MSRTDRKGKLFGKVSIVDAVVVLVLVIALAWFLYARYGRNLPAEMAAREQPVVYTIVVTTIRPTTADALEKGGRVFEFKTGAEIGTITGVTTEPAEVWTIIEEGQWLRRKADDRVDAYVTVEATARVGDHTITVNGVEVRVGTSIGITTKWAQVNGNILLLDLKGE